MHRIRCNEVWGGITLADSETMTRGVTASIFSAASAGTKGGDIYYLSVCSTDSLTRIAIADVRGHGEEVSSISEWLYGVMQDHMNSLDNTCVLRDLNNQVCERGFKALTTAAVVGYYLGDSNLYFSYAGHPPIFVRHGVSGWQAMPIENSGGIANLPLGVMRDVAFDQARITLKAGDRFFLYTDGVVECVNAAGEMFGEERLLPVLEQTADLPLAKVKASIASALRQYAGASLDHDDCTFMAVEVRPSAVDQRLVRSGFAW